MRPVGGQGRGGLLDGVRVVRRRLLQPLLLLLPLPVLLFRVPRPLPPPRIVHGHLDEQLEGFSPVH